MENGNMEEAGYGFLNTREAKLYFAVADYHLKNGMHIQREYPVPQGIFDFVHKHHKPLKEYYGNLFRVLLDYGGEEWNTYYYIDFNDGTRGNILNENREYLPVQHLITGLLLAHICKIDAHIEISTVTEFKRVLRQDYEEYKLDLYRLFAEAETKDSDYSDKKIDNMIDASFKAFDRLGWIALDEDAFKILPSIERLRKMYENEINRVEDIFNTNPADEQP